MVESNCPSSSATRSAALVGASSGAPLRPLGGAPPEERAPPEAGFAEDALADCAPPDAGLPEDALLDGELLDALLGALLLDDELLAEALLDEALLDEELLDDELAVCCSSEKSISSGGSPSLSEEGSGGMRDSCGLWSESV